MIKKLLLLFVVVFSFSSCGYKPTSTYASNAIEGKTFVSVKIDINNAVNTVLIKDALIELVIGKFNAKITSNKGNAQSFVSARLVSVSQTQLQSDEEAFSQVYRETVTVEVIFNKLKEPLRKIVVSNYYDFYVETDSVVTQSKKDEAVKTAIVKALSDVFSNIAVQSFKK